MGGRFSQQPHVQSKMIENLKTSVYRGHFESQRATKIITKAETQFCMCFEHRHHASAQHARALTCQQPCHAHVAHSRHSASIGTISHVQCGLLLMDASPPGRLPCWACVLAGICRPLPATTPGLNPPCYWALKNASA